MNDELALSGEDEKVALAHGLLDLVRSKVQYADVLIEEITKVEYTRLLSGDETMKPFSRKSAVQLRLVGDAGRHLSVSLGVMPLALLEPSVEAALSMLAFQEPDAAFGLAPIPNRERRRYGVPSTWGYDADALVLAFESLRREVQSLFEKATSAAPELSLSVQPELWCYAQVEEKLIADTEGLLKTQVLPSTFLQVTSVVKNEQSGRLTRQRTRLGDTQPLNWLFDEGHPQKGLRRDFAESVGSCARRAVQQQRGRRLTSEELSRITHYVLDPTAMVFVHEAEGHNFEADIVRDGGSGLLHADGTPRDTPFASDIVEVWDGQIIQADGSFDPLEGFGTHFIDDEGVELQPVRLVDKGNIVAMLHNRETAHHYGVAPNGHGFSELGDKRLVRMTNTYLYPAGKERWYETLDELIREVPFGVLLEGSLGGAVTAEGMSTTIQFGRLIRDGVLTDEVLLPANLSVVTKDSLKTVEGYAGPLRCDDPGFCGKGQTKTVTDGGPITLIRASAAITLGF